MKPIATIAALAACAAATAQDKAPDAAAQDPAPAAAASGAVEDLKYTLSGGYAHFFASDFEEGGGEVSVDRAFGGLSIAGTPSETYRWDLSLKWEGSWYGFEDGGTLSAAAGGAPWDAVQSVMIAPGATFVLDERWRASARVLVEFSGENDADAWDSASFGGVLGATYSFSREFLLGAGVLAITRIEDDMLVVPQVLVDWRPCDEFRLSNFAGPEAFPGGAGLEAIWTFAEDMELAFGGRYTYRRFRLDDSGDPARAGGVGTDEGLPVWLRATMRAKCGARLDLVAGVQMAGEMRLDDSEGDELAREDVDATAFVGVFFSWKY